MIKIPKKLSSKSTGIIFFLFYFLLPPAVTVYFKISLFKLFLFYLVCCLEFLFLLKKYLQKKRLLRLKEEGLREKINILSDQNSRERKTLLALRQKLQRYDSLEKIIQDINSNLELEFIADRLAETAFSLIGALRGSCMLYLVDAQTQKINLFKAKKEDPQLIIKEKEGDLFDLYLLRHATPLLVENTYKDFRFDAEKIKSQDSRPIASLISSPFISEHRFLGLLRLDNPLPGAYSQDDLRFLVTISEIGAVALENGELFRKTQDLATHDGLTSLYTKGFFLERLKEECIRSVRNLTPLSLLMLDIDYFKKYNDQFGHTAGDIVLKRLSQLLADSLKELNPLICRFGGEEFCILLSGTDKKQAGLIAQDLRKKVAETKVILRRQETAITVSLGVATLPQDAGSQEELIIKADRMMLVAKEKGRNRVFLA